MLKPLIDLRTAQTQRVLLGNSLTVKVGDAVTTTIASGVVFATNATANVAGDKYLLGVVVGFSKKNGEVYPTSGQDTSLTPNQVTTASDNLTNAKIHAVVVPFTSEMELEMDLDATAGTTTGSNQPFVYFNFANARTVSESSVIASDNASAPLQILSLGLIEGSNTKIRGRVVKALYMNSQ
jgi:hypothetical protein